MRAGRDQKRSPGMRSSLLTPLVILSALLAACGPSSRLVLPAGFSLEEHALRAAPILDPLVVDPAVGSMYAIPAHHAAERAQQFADNASMVGGHFSFLATLGSDTLTATENYDSTGGHGWVTLARNATEIYRIDTGMASPITSLRGLWTYDGHWVLETVDIGTEQAVGKLSQDGLVLNQRYGYDEIFDFQLLGGRPFYFFKRDGKIGLSYDAHEISTGYDEFPHYECCSPAVLNPHHAQAMVSFFARRGQTWYYVEAGSFK